MTKTEQKTEPRIVGFVCNWAAYTGVEMAGVDRIEYPASVKLVRLACLGRLNLGILLQAFEHGADGVIMLGCAAGECHYHAGTQKARELFSQARKTLGLLGIDTRRLALEEEPLGKGSALAKCLSAFAARIERLGPANLVFREEGFSWATQNG